MEQSTRGFLLLLRDAMRSAAPSAEAVEVVRALSTEEIEALLQLAQMQNVLPLVGGHLLLACPDFADADRLRSTLRQQVVRQSLCSVELLSMTRAFEAKKVPYFLVKGAFCRSLYPEPDLRPSSDEDLLVEPEFYAAAEDVLRELGYRFAEEQSGEQVHAWQGKLLHLELHSHLLKDRKIRILGEKEYFGPDFPQTDSFRFQETSISTLQPQAHLLFLIAHFYGHFLAGGVGIRQLCDLALMAERYEAELDWAQIWQTLRTLALDVFTGSLLEIAVRFLGMPRQAAPLPEGLSLPDCEPLLWDMLGAGVFGGSSKERKQSSLMTIEAAKTGRRASPLAAAFPPARVLQGRYPYLQKHPWLLPVAWGSRAARYLSGGGAAARAEESAKIGSQRMALLEAYGILSLKEE